MLSQIEFSKLWNDYKLKSGAKISATVTYKTDSFDMNKKERVSKISISNVDNFSGGKILFLSKEFNSRDYFTEFSARFQKFEYDGMDFIIRGNSMGNKNFGEYQVTLTDIEVLPKTEW